MNCIIKRRTIGIIVLLIAFLLIGILVYRQYHQASISHQLVVPSTPKVPVNALHEVDILLNQRPTNKVEVSPSASDISVPKSPEPAVVKSAPLTHAQVEKAQPHLVTQIPDAWVVQLATFSNSQNAQNLLIKVRKLGYDAYSQSITIDGKNLTKVFVGPNISRQKIERIQKDLNKRYHLHGLIQPYRARVFPQE